MADNFKFVQNQPSLLSGAGAVAGATTVILQSFHQIDGTLLTMTDFGTVGFGTIEPGNGVYEEQISFTGITQNANGTATLTGVSTVLMVSPYTQTSGLAQTHAGATTFIISNTSGFYNEFGSKDDDETFNGLITFVQFPVKSGSTTPTAQAQFATKAYVDSVAIAGAPVSTPLVQGIGFLSVTAASATGPIFVGTNDPRVSPISLASLTQGELDALVGTSGTASSSNKYVTNDDTSISATAGKLARRQTGTAPYSGGLTIPTGPTAPTDAASKFYVDQQDLATIMSSANSATGPASSTTQTVTHGLGRTPKIIRLFFTGNATGNASSASPASSFGLWNASGNHCVYTEAGIGGANAVQDKSATFSIRMQDAINGTTAFATGVVGNVGATTFDVVWTSTGTQANIVYLWEAQ